MSSAYQEYQDMENLLDNAIIMAGDVVVMVEDSDCEETEVDGEALVALLYTKFCRDEARFATLVRLAREGKKLGRDCA